MAINNNDEKIYVSPGVSHTGGNGDFSVVLNSVPGEKKEKATAPLQESKISAEENAKTAIDELRSRYYEQLREQYDYSAKKLREERDEALRENWILQQKAQAALPEQLAEKGINGGATETTLSGLNAQYQGERNDIRKEYLDEAGKLLNEQNGKMAEADRGYSEKWIEYLLSLAKMDEEYEHRKEFAEAGY